MCACLLALWDKVEDAVREWDHQGIWEPVEKSKWVLQMAMPIKPTGKVPVTTDFIPLNKSVVHSRYPLPNPEEHFLKTRGCSWFMKIDLVKGHHQIKLHPSSLPLTTTMMSRPAPLEADAPTSDRLQSQIPALH